MELSTEMQAAIKALDDAIARQKVIANLITSDGGEKTRAAARIVEIDREHAETDARIGETAALVSAGLAAPLPGDEYARLIDRMQALENEREENDDSLKLITARGAALGRRAAAARDDIVQARREFVAAYVRFMHDLGVELARDLAERPLPEVFRRWYPLHVFDEWLDHLVITIEGVPIIDRGKWCGPNGLTIDYRKEPPADASLAAFRDELVALRIKRQRCGTAIAEAERQAAMVRESAWREEKKKRDAEFALAHPMGHYAVPGGNVQPPAPPPPAPNPPPPAAITLKGNHWRQGDI